MLPIRDHNPSRHPAYVTWALIAANVAIHLWSMAVLTTDRAVYDFYLDYALFPVLLSQGDGLLGLVSSVFLHADLMHLAGNMLFLWIFGDNLEDELGHFGFVAFYLLCGVGAGAAQWLADPMSTVPTIGASGAIAGVMGGYLLFFPRAKVDILIFLIVLVRIVPVPAWLMLGLWFALQLVNGLSPDASGAGVAYWAHAGGFVVGAVALIPAFLRRGGTRYWGRTEGHPPHDETRWGKLAPSSVPAVRRAGNRRGPW